MALILDTGVVLALLNAKDRHHRACVDLVNRTHEPLVVPAAILGELDYWVCKHLGVSAWRVFVEDVERGAYLLEPTTEVDLVRVADLEEQYADLALGFVDAAVIVLCERMREPKVATIDRRDFAVVVPRHVASLELLPA
ncbi:MAG: PIN domain-containing protein [Chloroflexi bacterium]|nr:PIN domain-containing protein [Chloroflexota bacterium]